MKFYPGCELVYMDHRYTARKQGWGLTGKQGEPASCSGKPVGCGLRAAEAKRAETGGFQNSTGS